MLHTTYLLLVDLLDHGHSEGHLLLLPGDDYLCLVDAGRRHVDACARLRHHLQNQLVGGAGDEGVVHLIDAHPLHRTLVLQGGGDETLVG